MNSSEFNKEAVLFIFEQGTPLSVVPIKKNMTIGRDYSGSTSDIKLLSKIVSRNHGEFIFEAITGNCCYQDKGSLNGTYINGDNIASRGGVQSPVIRLKDGDVIKIDAKNNSEGSVTIIYSTTLKANREWKHIDLRNLSMAYIGKDVKNNVAILSDKFSVFDQVATLRKLRSEWIIEKNQDNSITVNGKSIGKEQLLSNYTVLKIHLTMECISMLYFDDTIIYSVGEIEIPFQEDNYRDDDGTVFVGSNDKTVLIGGTNTPPNIPPKKKNCCSKCGTEFLADEKFCRKCGNPANRENVGFTPPTPPTPIPPAPPTQGTSQNGSLQNTPLSMWAYFGYTLLFNICGIGWIIALIFAIGGTQNINLRNLARSQFCFGIIIGVILLIVLLSGGFTSVIANLR